MANRLLQLILVLAALFALQSEIAAQQPVSSAEAEVLHWVLYEASLEDKAEAAQGYLLDQTEEASGHESYSRYLEEWGALYEGGISPSGFFRQVVLPEGLDHLFVAYLDEWSPQQIEQYTGKHELGPSASRILSGYRQGSLEEIAIQSSDLHLGLYALDAPEWYRAHPEMLGELKQSWQSAQGEMSPLENAALSFFLIRFGFNIGDVETMREIYQAGYTSVLPPVNFILGSYSMFYSSLYERGYFEELLNLMREELLPYTGEEAFGSDRRIFNIRLRYAMTLLRVGNVDEALSSLESIAHLVEQDESTLQHFYPYYFNNLGVVYHRLGHYREYIDLQLQALDYARVQENKELEIEFLNNLYRFYRANDDWNRAGEFLQEALEVAEASENEQHAYTLLSMAIYQRDYLRNYDKAYSFFSEALNASIEEGDFETEIRIKTEKSRMFREQGRYTEALALQSEIIQDAREAGAERNMLLAKINYAELQLDQQNFEQAREYLARIQEHTLEDYGFRLQLRAVNASSRLQLVTGEPQQAYEQLVPYIELALDRIQNSTDYQTGRTSLLPQKEDAFDRYARILYEMQDFDELVPFLDRLKNLSQADFHNHHLLKSRHLSEEELIYETELTRRIDQLREQYRQAGGGQKAELSTLLLEAENEKNRLRQKIHDQELFDPPDLRAIQFSLDRDEMALTYNMVGNRMYVLAIGRNDIRGRVHEYSEEELHEIEQAIDAMHRGETDLTFLRGIKQDLIREEWLSGIRRIEVIPDHFMHYIPHEILPVSVPDHASAYGSTRYLIEETTINYRHSLNQMIRDNGAARSYENDIMAMGVSEPGDRESVLNPHVSLPDLPFAAEEARAISEIYNPEMNIRVFTGEEATYRNFKNHAPGSSVVHLAAHGEVSPHDPLFSVIYLGDGAGGSPSHIYAYELFELDLSSRLVVMSSCESGAGTYIKGGGIAGMSRAFRFAGTESMAMNLWPVRDETSRIITSQFYRELNEGVPRDEALQEAKLDYLNSRNSDPFYWGAMMMYGDPSPLHPESGRHIALSILLLWAGLLAAISILKTRNSDAGTQGYQGK